MIKYFLVNNTSRASVYGIGTYIKQLADCIKCSLDQYELCFLDIYSDVEEFTVEKDENGFCHYRIPSFKSCGDSFLYDRCILFFLDSYVKEEDEVIFHFNYSQHFDLMRLVKAKYRFCRTFYTIHYLSWCFTLNGNLTQFRKLIHSDTENEMKRKIRDEYQNDRRLFSLCDEIIVLAKFTYDLLLVDYKQDEAKIHLVYNGMKTESTMARSCSKEILQKEILFVGRLDPIKGIEYIIKAFKMVLAHTENIHLTLVGDGDFSQYLVLCEGIWDKVTFTGKLAKDQLEQFYSKATIGIQPSFHEQCSYSAIEMMAHGIPFIATDSTGLGEMMDYTPECLVHINEDDFQPDAFVEQLAEKMDLLLSDSQLRRKISNALQQLFCERYSLGRMSKALGMILDSHRPEKTIISGDFLPYLDNEMIRLINDRPALDMDYVGLTGIGCYLWWRICWLNRQNDKASIQTSAKLQEHLIYQIDWIYDTIYKEQGDAFSERFEPMPFFWLLDGLREKGFYKTKVEALFRLVEIVQNSVFSVDKSSFVEKRIPQNALRIYNAKF